MSKRGPIWIALTLVLATLILFALTVRYIPPIKETSSLQCVLNLRQLAIVKVRWELEHHKTTNDIPTAVDLREFFKNGQLPTCPAGGIYTLGRLDEPPKCSLGGRHVLP